MVLNKTTVLYVFCFENYSGAEIVTERLMAYNTDNVLPLVMCPEGDYANLLRKKGITVIVQNALRPLKVGENSGKSVKLLFSLMAKMLVINLHLLYSSVRYHVNIVHVSNMYASFYCLPSLIFSKVFLWRKKYIWSNHDLTYFSGKLGDKLAALCHKFYRRTLAVSNAVKNKFPQYRDKISVLYNGLDANIFQPDTIERQQFRQKREIPSAQICIGILGGMVEHKGHLLLLNSVNKLARNNYNFKLFIVGKFVAGNPEYSKQLGALIAGLPAGQVELIGHTSNIAEIYNGLDVVINATLPGISEPLGTTIYEGMAYEKIVIASNTGGTPEIIDDKVNGYLFEAGNSEALTEKLAYVIDNYPKLEDIRKNARKKTVDVFNIKLMVANYNNILQQV